MTSSSFRSRDFIAIILLLYLTSMAYYPNNYNDSDLSASIRFSFVVPKQQQQQQNDRKTMNTDSSVLISMLDIDGDHISEALAFWRNDNNNNEIQEGTREEWSLQILDLSRISLSSMNRYQQQRHPSSSSSLITTTSPFQPKEIFTSSVTGKVINPHQKFRTDMSNEDIEANNMRFYPLAITTGHIIFPDGNTDQEEMGKNINPENGDKTKDDEPTNYYYCGSDWHDASQKCQYPCPSGSGCPEGQRCFAECRTCPSSNPTTNGDNLAIVDDQQQRNVEYHTTVAGGWPSICTIWSQGQITMHTITAEKEINDTSAAKKKPSSSSLTSKLQLRQLWNVSILLPDDRESYYRENGTQPVLELEEVAITFVDPISSAMIFPSSSSSSSNAANKNTEKQNHGIVLATGTVTAFYYQANEHRVPDSDYDSPLHALYDTFVIAYDAYTGQRIWHTTSTYDMEHLLFYPDGRPNEGRKRDAMTTTATTTDPALLPRHGRISSILRRRSGMVSIHERQMIMDESTYQEYEALKRQGTTSHINCLKEYRRSIFTTAGTLPYQFDGTDEYSTKVIVTHFDHQGITSEAASKQHHHKNPKHSWQKKAGKTKKSKKQFINHVEYGRPNVVVVHNFQGIHVHALRNGRSICHISLSDRTVYDDVDHDGTIDSIQLFNIEEFKSNVPSDTEVDDDGVIAQNKLYDMLQEQLDRHNISDSKNDEASLGDPNNNNKDTRYGKDIVPCYALSVTSGLSSVEPRHFQTIACHNSDAGAIQHAPILLIDHPIVSSMSSNHHHHHHHHPSDHVRNYKDVVVALNNGMIGRLHGKYGNWLWKNDAYDSMQHRRESNTNIRHPTWNESSMVTLEQLYVNHYQSSESPILLVGQDGIAILSSMSGRTVAAVTLPQLSTIQRPYIFDMNGDGTSDIVVVTDDAIWGYTIIVRTTNGMSTSYRIMVGFIMLGLMLAYLRNRFGPRPGKRSTDL